MSLLEKSLQEFGAGRSILIDKNNNIIAGNGIVEAAGQIGLEDVEIVETTGEKIIAVKRTDIALTPKKVGKWLLQITKLVLLTCLGEEKLKLHFNEEDLIKWGGANILGSEVDWDKVNELSDDTYDEPEHEMLECPACHHIDRKIHFKKVGEEQ